MSLMTSVVDGLNVYVVERVGDIPGPTSLSYHSTTSIRAYRIYILRLLSALTGYTFYIRLLSALTGYTFYDRPAEIIPGIFWE